MERSAMMTYRQGDDDTMPPEQARTQGEASVITKLKLLQWAWITVTMLAAGATGGIAVAISAHALGTLACIHVAAGAIGLIVAGGEAKWEIRLSQALLSITGLGGVGWSVAYFMGVL